MFKPAPALVQKASEIILSILAIIGFTRAESLTHHWLLYPAPSYLALH